MASLLYFLYFYFVTLSSPAPGEDWTAPVAFNTALFGLFAVHHSVMARPPAKRWLARLLPESVERTLFVWVSSVLLWLVCVLWWPVPGVAYDVRGAGMWLLHGVQAAGIGLTILASAKLDVLELAGIRQVRGAWRPRAPAPLQLRGPYTLVRHPVYLGWAMLVFAAPRMTGGRLAFAVISTLYLMMAVPLEERALEQSFGESYREYKRRVQWRFLPGLY